ncbi:MAG: efflux RND transporter periplasmic adaptor subunit [Casimicrobiaceae bacterium]
MKTTVHAVSALTLAALFAAGCARHESPPEPVRPVTLAQVQAGGTGEVAVFAGEIKPRHEGDLAFRIGGKVIARSVDVGARVTRGQVLAKLDPADTGLQAEAQKAAAAAAETEFKYAQSEYERYQNLYRQKFVSESALDQKRNALDTNRAKLEQAKAQLAVTRNQAGYATLVATDDGVITAASVEAGQVVTAGQTMFKMAREEEREVAISVPENRIGELRRADTLGVVLWANPQKLYPARVREISPAVDPVTRTFAVRLSVLERDPALQWGMTANVVAQRREPGNTTLLPLTSLYRKDGAAAVWVYDPDARKVSLRPVTVGQYREDGVLLTSGVAPGEWIVTAGVHKLREGETVRPYEGGSAGAARAPSPAAAPATAPRSAHATDVHQTVVRK